MNRKKSQQALLAPIFCISIAIILIIIIQTVLLINTLMQGAFPGAEVILTIHIALLLMLAVLIILLCRLNRILRHTGKLLGEIVRNNNLAPKDAFSEQRNGLQDFPALIRIIGDNLKNHEPNLLLQTQMQLLSIQNQINPHFLYNALDSIRGMAISQEANATADMTEALSAFFRYSISDSNSLVSLAAEILNVYNYIQIQKYRFKDRFDLVEDIDLTRDKLNKYSLPKLTLQPIVENALNHGLKEVRSNGLITLRIRLTRSHLLISISDNGIGMEEGVLNRLNQNFINYSSDLPKYANSAHIPTGMGIALINVNMRLKLLFGDQFGITVYSTKGLGTEVQIALPPLKEEDLVD